MNKIILSIGGEDWECIQKDGCVDIYQCQDYGYIGTVNGISIPDETDEDEMNHFTTEIESYLVENYF